MGGRCIGVAGNPAARGVAQGQQRLGFPVEHGVTNRMRTGCNPAAIRLREGLTVAHPTLPGVARRIEEAE